jgi:hypothetical protein
MCATSSTKHVGFEAPYLAQQNAAMTVAGLTTLTNAVATHKLETLAGHEPHYKT